LLILQTLLTFRRPLGGRRATATGRMQEFRDVLVVARRLFFQAVRVLGQLGELAFQFMRDGTQMVGQVGELLGHATVRDALLRAQTKVRVESSKRNQRAKRILLILTDSVVLAAQPYPG